MDAGNYSMLRPSGTDLLRDPRSPELTLAPGVELGSTEGTIPDDATIVAWGRAALGF